MSFQEAGRSQLDTVEANQPERLSASGEKKDDIADVHQLEHVLSDDPRKDLMDYERVDPEVAKYASDGTTIVSEEDNKRLKWLIDTRVLSIMIFTYFLQALGR